MGYNTLYQYSTSGVFLQSGIPNGLPTYFESGGNDAGDFAEPVPSVPEPGSLTFLGMGAAGLVGYGWPWRVATA